MFERGALWFVVLLVTGLAAAWAIGVWRGGTSSGTQFAKPAGPPNRAEALEACRRHVRAAQTRAEESISRRSREFSEFIASRATAAKGFADRMVSCYAKWRLVKEYLPFTDGDGHRHFVEEEFARHLFSSEELAAALDRSVEFALRDLDQIENELAVALRTEILGHSLASDETSAAGERFTRTVEQMLRATQWDAAKSAGSLVFSEVVSSVGTRILVQLGISAGILGAGAANSWWSFGATAVIGLLVDAIWEWFDDPVGDIERELSATLDNLARGSSEAIRDELNRIVAARSAVWSQFVEEQMP